MNFSFIPSNGTTVATGGTGNSNTSCREDVANACAHLMVQRPNARIISVSPMVPNDDYTNVTIVFEEVARS